MRGRRGIITAVDSGREYEGRYALELGLGMERLLR